MHLGVKQQSLVVAVAASMEELACKHGPGLAAPTNQAPDCQHLWYQKVKTRVISRISCLALPEKIWQIFNGRNPHTPLCCSTKN